MDSPLSLLHPSVQKARERWNKCRAIRASKSKLDFDEVFLLLCDPDRSFSAIAQQAGISRYGFSLQYQNHFEVLFGVSGKDRYHLKQKERKKEKEAGLKNLLPFTETAAYIIRQAKKKGVEISAVLGRTEGNTAQYSLQKRIILNEHLASMHSISVVRKWGIRGTQVYARASISHTTLANVDVMIFHLHPKNYKQRLFIIPSATIQETLFKDTDKEETQLYLPVARPTHIERSNPRMNLWDYENNWEFLLTKKNSTKAHAA